METVDLVIPLILLNLSMLLAIRESYEVSQLKRPEEEWLQRPYMELSLVSLALALFILKHVIK